MAVGVGGYIAAGLALAFSIAKRAITAQLTNFLPYQYQCNFILLNGRLHNLNDPRRYFPRTDGAAVVPAVEVCSFAAVQRPLDLPTDPSWR